MSTVNAGKSLGDFLSREHGLKGNVISTTTYISELDDTINGWCLIAPQQQYDQKITKLTQRIGELEYTTKQLMDRLNKLEKVCKVYFCCPFLLFYVI